MNPPTIKDLNLRSIGAALVIAFVALLFLIGLIGRGSSLKLQKISGRARESGDNYMERLALALRIRESAAELISEARLARAPQDMVVPNPAFKSEFGEAKKRFQTEMERGKKLWLKHGGPEILSQEEIDAWGKVETIAQKFIEIQARMQKLKDQEVRTNEPEAKKKSEPPKAPAAAASGGQPPSEPEQDTHELVRIVQDEFLKARIDLDNAAVKLTESVANVQKQIFSEFAAQERQAASEIDIWTVITLALGFGVAAFTLKQTRKQFIQLKQANQKEQEAKDLARSIFDSQSNDILVVNNKGELREVNQAFRNHFDLSASSEISQNYRVALARLPEVAAFVDKALAQPDDSSNLRERLEVKSQDGHNGDTRLFDVYTSPLTISGQTEGRVVVIVDVTEAEKVREELRRSRTLSAVGQITATVAHELYNPIGAVKLNLDLLEMQVGNGGDLKQVVARLKRGVEHLSTIVMDLRHLTRTREPERQTTDLNGLLDEVVELASDRLERSRVCVERNYSTELPQGEYDPQQLRKVFLNLLINAVEASPQNGGVELRTRYFSGDGAPSSTNGSQTGGEPNGDRGALVISVVDRGVGMSGETERRLFEAFYTTKHNGTGLGMMITQEIVKKHGGRIEVESAEGKGTTVSVYLPV
jgi:PAS domain S-box-containing protein